MPWAWGPEGGAVLGVTHRPKARRSTFSVMWEVMLPTQSGKQSLPRAILVSPEPALPHSAPYSRSPDTCTWRGGSVAVLRGRWPQLVSVPGLLWGSRFCLFSRLCHLSPGSSWLPIQLPRGQRGSAPTGDTGTALGSPQPTHPCPLPGRNSGSLALSRKGDTGTPPGRLHCCEGTGVRRGGNSRTGDRG